MVMQLPTSLTVSRTQESLRMQQNGRGTLNSSSNREHHSKKLSLKPIQGHQVWVGVQDGLCSACLPSLACSTHCWLEPLLCLCKIMSCVALLTHPLTNRTSTETLLLLVLHQAMTKRRQLYLIWFYTPYYCCTGNIFQNRIRIPQSYQTIHTGRGYDIPWPTGKWTQSTSMNWEGKNTWRDHRNLLKSCSLGYYCTTALLKISLAKRVV